MRLGHLRISVWGVRVLGHELRTLQALGFGDKLVALEFRAWAFPGLGFRVMSFRGLGSSGLGNETHTRYETTCNRTSRYFATGVSIMNRGPDENRSWKDPDYESPASACVCSQDRVGSGPRRYRESHGD